MTPERVASLVARWTRFYTRDLPPAVAARRVAEIEADLHDQVSEERAAGAGDRRIAISLASRMVRGVAADLAWRDDQARAASIRPSIPGGPVYSKTAYRSAIVVAIGAALFLAWGVAAMGVIGAEGDPFDRLYFGVLAVGVVGAAVARLQPLGMYRTLLAMAGAQAIVAVIALIAGKHEVPVSSVAEIVGLNGVYVALFLGAAWLFRRASQQGPGERRGFDA